MTKFIAGADKIRSLYGSAVKLVHHTGHGDKTRARGSIALKAALDAEYRFERGLDNIIRVTATKMKDAPFPDPMAFKIQVVNLQIVDDDLNSVTSAVLQRVDYQPPAVKRDRGMGDNQKLGLSILRSLFIGHKGGVEIDNGDPISAKVYTDEWRDACMNTGMNRNKFWRIKESLIKRGVIQSEGDHTIVVD